MTEKNDAVRQAAGEVADKLLEEARRGDVPDNTYLNSRVSPEVYRAAEYLKTVLKTAGFRAVSTNLVGEALWTSLLRQLGFLVRDESGEDHAVIPENADDEAFVERLIEELRK